MTTWFNRIREIRRRLWTASAPLTTVAVVMTAALAASTVAMAVDPRLITGAPAWLKPAKFAASTAIYSITLAWVFQYLPDWRRLRAIVGWGTAAIFVIEVAIIDVQAWRGTASHFNVGTPLDAVLFSVMGSLIVLQTLSAVAVAVALVRQRFADRAMGAALRAGMIITIVGASTGGLMTRPTGAQLADARATGRMLTAGAHTVGAADGGPGIPGTHWSREHGDLRVPHFVGLHALQVLPIVAVIASRRRGTSAAVATVRAVAMSHGALFAILLAQALRGEPVLSPGPATSALLVGWAAATAMSLWVTGTQESAAGPRRATAAR